QRRHRPRAHVVVHRADELVPVGEALVEVAFGQPGLPAHRANRQRRAFAMPEQLHPGGDQLLAPEGLTIRQGHARPAAPPLTGGHGPPKLTLTTYVVSLPADGNGKFTSDSRYF